MHLVRAFVIVLNLLYFPKKETAALKAHLRGREADLADASTCCVMAYMYECKSELLQYNNEDLYSSATQHSLCYVPKYRVQT